MEKSELRLPVVYEFFKDQQEFNKYLEIAGSEVTYHKLFLDDWSKVLTIHAADPKLTFAQALVKAGILPIGIRASILYKDEMSYLINNLLILPELIYVWGSYGKDREQKFKDWNAKKPKLNTPLTTAEIAKGYASLKNYEVYAKRYEYWVTQEPKMSFVLLNDLTTEEMKSILAEPDILEDYRKILERLVHEREGNVESIKVKDVEIEC